MVASIASVAATYGDTDVVVVISIHEFPAERGFKFLDFPNDEN
jgi:hypothetical protein